MRTRRLARSAVPPSASSAVDSRELAAVRDDDRLGGGAALAADGLAGLDDLHARGHGAEDDVLAVEPVGLDRAEEEPVRVPSAPRFSDFDTR